MEPARQGVERADRRSRIRQKGWERPLTIQLSHLLGRSTRAALGPRAGTSGGGWEGRQRVEIGIGDRVLNVRSIKPNASMISPRCPAGTGPRRSPRRPKQCLPAISRAGLPLDELATVYYATIATQDTGRFAGCGIRLIDPWTTLS